jgi:F420-0:gamma-glutamyl ligase-like protein
MGFIDVLGYIKRRFANIKSGFEIVGDSKKLNGKTLDEIKQEIKAEIKEALKVELESIDIDTDMTVEILEKLDKNIKALKSAIDKI